MAGFGIAQISEATSAPKKSYKNKCTYFYLEYCKIIIHVRIYSYLVKKVRSYSKDKSVRWRPSPSITTLHSPAIKGGTISHFKAKKQPCIDLGACFGNT